MPVDRRPPSVPASTSSDGPPRTHAVACRRTASRGWLPVRLAAVVLLLAAPAAPAVVPDERLAEPLWTSGEVTAVLPLADGSTLIGGRFELFEGQPLRNLVRLTPDGSVDPSFGPNPEGTVKAIVTGPDGMIYIGGDFRRFGGVPRLGLARLRADRTLDAWQLSLPDGGDSRVDEIRFDAGGRLYLVGRHNFAIDEEGKIGPPCVIRLMSDGRFDDSFLPDLGGAGSCSAAFDAAGRLVVGGDFEEVNGVAQTGITRLLDDGSRDATFAATANFVVTRVAIDSQQRIVAVGPFTTMNGVPRRGAARLAPDGTTDPAFAPTIEGRPTALAIDALDRILLGGIVRSIDSVPRSCARFLPSGAPDPTFAVDVTDRVYVLQPLPDGGLWLAGGVRRIGKVTDVAGIARLDASGAVMRGLAAEELGDVEKILATPGGIYVAGDFRRIGLRRRDNLLRLHSDGSLDVDWRVDADGKISHLEPYSGGVLAVGSFRYLGGILRPFVGVVRHEGVADPGFTTQFAREPLTVHREPDGTIYVSGGLEIDGHPRRAGRILPSGQVDPSWVVAVGGGAYRFAVVPDQGVYVAGPLVSVGGQPWPHGVALLDAGVGKLDPAFQPPIGDSDYGARSEIVMLRPTGDGRLWVGGTMFDEAGERLPGMLRLDEDGSIDAGFDVRASLRLGSVRDMIVEGAELVVVNGSRLRRISAATGARVSSWEVVASSDIRSIATTDPPTHYVIGGYFQRVGGLPRLGIASIPADSIFGSGFESQ